MLNIFYAFLLIIQWRSFIYIKEFEFFFKNVIIQIGPCAISDWSKTHVLSECKTNKKCVLLFFSTLPLYHKANKEAIQVNEKDYLTNKEA